ncbi:nucleotide sugar dehydrogenase [Maritimibacter dapengensis]|uniref:Nucleotide sugar dehydrogenase n=1 Tax=Maritimibacter dapengensis TaxID=2836868 RepID=A0ABS6T621_9RHOB|nr:nucleotide sugar dehydrogenase [Maritimibacter dapengensis]MBV7379802.1 nucleotide sugar dehydrogenase [Maritimibacter dapengensis]
MSDNYFEKLLDSIQHKSARVGVIGLGYVGLPLAVTTAKRGFPVTGFDVAPDKIEKLEESNSYIEAVASGDLQALNASDSVDWTTDFAELSKCGVIVICVPTPLTKYREPDLSFVRQTAEVIAEHVAPGSLVVLESTTYPGTTVEVLKPIIASSGHGVGSSVFLGFSPEREDPGNASYRTATIPKIVAGDGKEAGALVQAFYENVVDKVVPVSTTQTAEAVKIAENVFRAVNIALVNELKVIFDAMGIDVWEVIDGASTKPFGFMPFYPGPGLGGHCIPIDPFYLTWRARELELSTKFIELAGEINTDMPHYVVTRLREVLDRECGIGLSRAKILVVGIAYKKNVSDMRESPSMRLMEILKGYGAHVEFLDPHVPEVPPMRDYPDLVGLRSIDTKDLEHSTFDAVLISTDHDNVDYSALLELGVPVIDTRNAIARRGLSLDNVTKA